MDAALRGNDFALLGSSGHRLRRVALGVWPEGLLDSHFAVILRQMEMPPPFANTFVCLASRLSYLWHPFVPTSWRTGPGPRAPEPVASAGSAKSSVEAQYGFAIDVEEVFFSGAVDHHLHLFVADVVSPLTLLIGVSLIRFLVAWDCPPGSARPALSLMLMSVFSTGMGEPWTRDACIPQGCPLSMMFTVALLSRTV